MRISDWSSDVCSSDLDFFNSGATWRDGKTPVNVSGGLESKGHPIAATGIANIWEVCHHLRGEAGDRQIEGAKVGLAHVIGLGSACGVLILARSPSCPALSLDRPPPVLFCPRGSACFRRQSSLPPFSPTLRRLSSSPPLPSLPLLP